MVIRAVGIFQHLARSTPAIGQIKEQMIEHQPIVKRRLAHIDRRIRKTPLHLAPCGLARTEPRVQIPSKDAMLRRGQLLNERSRLPPAGSVAEQRVPPGQSILEVDVDDEQPLTCDDDVRGGDSSRLALSRQWNDARPFERLRGQDGVAADPAVQTANRKKEREQMTGGGDCAERLVVALDIFLQQHHVIARDGARQSA